MVSNKYYDMQRENMKRQKWLQIIRPFKQFTDITLKMKYTFYSPIAIWGLTVSTEENNFVKKNVRD
jgi:hypothetical protein